MSLKSSAIPILLVAMTARNWTIKKKELISLSSYDQHNKRTNLPKSCSKCKFSITKHILTSAWRKMWGPARIWAICVAWATAAAAAAAEAAAWPNGVMWMEGDVVAGWWWWWSRASKDIVSGRCCAIWCEWWGKLACCGWGCTVIVGVVVGKLQKWLGVKFVGWANGCGE